MRLGFGSTIAIAATVVALSGCGGSSSGGSSSSSGASSTATSSPADQAAAFKSGFVPAVNGLRDTSHAIGVALQQAASQTNAQITATFHALAGRWQTQLAALQQLKAPPQFASDFVSLTNAATQVKSDLDAVATAAATSDQTAARQAGRSVVVDVLAAKSASASITKALGSK